jgi:hypothetical protein
MRRRGARRGALGAAALATGLGLAVAGAGCGGGSSDTGPTVAACDGRSPEGLETESTSGGQCPAAPVVLTGKGGPGAQCASAADCAPACCSCAGGSKSALAAMCDDGNCLDANDTCCLYSLGCD